ncbi:hypothetical protein GGR54DRAFT_314269 [Hypoxylon sp. NC1633]|nr:hypothetical protein GGR54DRAFT_314269 [Hypoxylon sp. NC1633]
MSLTPFDDSLLSLPGGWPRSPFHPRRSRSRQSSRSSSAPDNIGAIEDLNKQLSESNQQNQKLKELLDSKCANAEKVVQKLLRNINGLKHALKESETQRQNEAEEHRQARKKAERYFNDLCDDRKDLKCEVSSHQEIISAFEVSLEEAAQAIRAEAARTDEVRALTNELRVTNKTLADERGVSRVVSQQVEYFDRMVRLQHGEIKRQKEAIDDLEQYISVLREENDRLQYLEATSPTTSSNQGAVAEAMEDEVHKLEETISESIEKNQSLQAQLEQEQRKTSQFRSQVGKLEKQNNTLADILEAKQWELKTQTLQLDQKKKALISTQDELVRLLREITAHEQPRSRSQGPPVLRLTAMSNPSNTRSTSLNDQFFTNSRAGPTIQINSRPPAPTAKELERQVARLEIRNHELEDEVQHLRGVGADLSGLHPLERVSARTRWREASTFLNVPSGSEQILEFRLPSPGSSAGNSSRSPNESQSDSPSPSLSQS